MSRSNAALKAPEETTHVPFSTGENFAELFEASMKGSDKKEGSIVKGLVVSIENDTVTVDLGLKSEGRIPLKEFVVGGKPAELRPGDTVEVYLEKIENRHGEAVISREKALREESWTLLEQACAKAEKVMGVIFGKVKGGFTVDIDGAVAFLPGSQVDIRPVKDVGPLMHIQQPFMILKMDRKRGNIVVSRRAILEESRTEQRSELLGRIREGAVLDGMVKNITDYGAFIDLGGVDGLLHVTDISWKRINHPSEVLHVGQNIRVIVTKFDEATKRVGLGIKQLEKDPWEGIKDRFQVGARFKGKVTNLTDYGAFVELVDGIEGLVHVSEMSWTKKNTHPSKIVAVSQEVDVVVLDVDPVKHRISLGIKQTQDNPWEAYASQHHAGEVIEGEIRNITEFGLFVGLGPDIDGLVHYSDLSWNEPADVAIKHYTKGNMVKAKILSVDTDKERISLGIKQLEHNPMDSEMDAIKKGSTVTVAVTKVEDKGIEVKLTDNLTAFIKKGDLSRERSEQRPERFAVGDRVDAKVTSVDKLTNKIGLSIKALEVDDAKRAIEEYGSTDSGASLGDILGAALKEADKKGKKED